MDTLLKQPLLQASSLANKGRINAIGAIIGFSFALGLFQGSITVMLYLGELLIPVLPENAVVVMVNAAFASEQMS